VACVSIFALAGRKGGHARAARYDGLAVTAKARETFAGSFADGHGCVACGPRVEIPASLPAAERDRRAEALRKKHYAALALRRAQKKAATATSRSGDGLTEGRGRGASSGS